MQNDFAKRSKRKRRVSGRNFHEFDRLEKSECDLTCSERL